MKKGIKKYLFYSVFIHLVLISALLISLFELGHLSFNEKVSSGLTHISVYNSNNSLKANNNQHNVIPQRTDNRYIQTKKNVTIKSALPTKKPLDFKNQYKIAKNSSRMSVEENIADDNILQKEAGNKIKEEILKGGNENNEAAPVKSSAKPEYGLNAKPEYPMVARRRGYEGEVVFNVRVLNDGNVGEMEIIKTSGYAVLDNSAHSALKKWKFVPGKYNGKYVHSWVQVPILFRLNDI